MGDVDNGGGCAYMRVEGIWEISVPSSHFCCDPKSTPKKVEVGPAPCTFFFKLVN